MSEKSLEEFLRDRGGLEGLARELGQDDPARQHWQPPANENNRIKGATFGKRLYRLLLRLWSNT